MCMHVCSHTQMVRQWCAKLFESVFYNFKIQFDLTFVLFFTPNFFFAIHNGVHLFCYISFVLGLATKLLRLIKNTSSLRKVDTDHFQRSLTSEKFSSADSKVRLLSGITRYPSS